MSNNLIIDFSEDYVTVHQQGKTLQTEIDVENFWGDTQAKSDELKEFFKEKNFYFGDWLATIPVRDLNHQIVSLPENVSDKEKMVFLGIELDRKHIGKKFGVQKLEVTKRKEGDQELCDYLVLAAKENVQKSLKVLASVLGKSLKSIVPSFYLHGAEDINELRASAWIGDNRTEVVIWGKDNPLSIVSFINNGDQIGDVNRFIVDYFDNVDGLNLSKVYLFGPKMRDPAIAYGMSYPYEILQNPIKHLQENLQYATQHLDISNEVKLPKAPLAMTPRNITMLVCLLIALVITGLTAFNYVRSFALKRELMVYKSKSSKYRKLLKQHKLLKQEEAELEAEYDFYIGITKRRTPWQKILTDVSRLTPPEMWFERVSASKTKLLISGKAGTVQDVSNFSINLNSNSEFIEKALVIGTRDYEEAGQVYSEFQITTTLKSPTGEFEKVTI